MNRSDRSTNVRFARRHPPRDLLISLGCALTLGPPLFVLGIALFSLEHDVHEIAAILSIPGPLGEILPRHLVSLVLWLSIAWVTTFAIRQMLLHRQQSTYLRERLAVSQTLALTDELTGAWNRRGFDQLLLAGLARARQFNHPFTIVLADVDGLKQYNDVYGHPCADVALRAVIRLLNTQIRSADALARYGGDEFAILCPELDRTAALSLIERLERTLASAPLKLSFGLATFPVDGPNTESLIEVADGRLYQSKARHRPKAPTLAYSQAQIVSEG